MASLRPLRSAIDRHRRVRRHHDGAERARRRIEYEAVAERALTRDPQPVRQHHVGGAALERDLAGFGRGKLDGVDLQTGFAVEPVRPDDIEFPRQRAGALHGEPDAVGGACRACGQQPGSDGDKHTDEGTQHDRHARNDAIACFGCKCRYRMGRQLCALRRQPILCRRRHAQYAALQSSRRDRETRLGMEFGVFDHLDRYSGPLADFYEDRLRIAEAYDRAGFYAYHLAEHHSTPLGMAPSPSVFLSAVAQRTRTAALRSAGVGDAAASPAAADRGNLHARPDERRPAGDRLRPRLGRRSRSNITAPIRTTRRRSTARRSSS